MKSMDDYIKFLSAVLVAVNLCDGYVNGYQRTRTNDINIYYVNSPQNFTTAEVIVSTDNDFECMSTINSNNLVSCIQYGRSELQCGNVVDKVLKNLTENSECTDYTVNIKCTNCSPKYDSFKYNPCVRHNIRSSYSGSLGKVENLQTTARKSNRAILITWNAPAKHKSCVKKYSIKLTPDDESTRSITTSSNTYHYLITAFKPNTSYIVDICAVDESGTEGIGSVLNFTTYQWSKSAPIVEDKVKDRKISIQSNTDTQAKLKININWFDFNQDKIQNFTIIVSRSNPATIAMPPAMPTWAQAIMDPSVNKSYQTTPNQWMPFNRRNHSVIFTIGKNNTCSVNDKKTYCNGPLKTSTEHWIIVRACDQIKCTALLSDSFTTLDESTTTSGNPIKTNVIAENFYLRDASFVVDLYCTVLYMVLLGAVGLYCVLLNINVPKSSVSNRSREPLKLLTKVKLEDVMPADMDYDQLLDQTREMEKEFGLLEVFSKPNHSSIVAISLENKCKNRYNDILPYDHNRVVINSDDNNYINASFIRDPKINQQYIACQGPMHCTCTDMWQMILDHNVTSIIMLCQTIENNKVKCEKYYPDLEESLNYGDITVYNNKCTNYTCIDNMECTYSISELRVVKGELGKTINHFHFHDWPDFGTPSDHSTLLEFCLEVQAKSADDGLMVVHCSAGVGRTGTFIACDMLLRLIHQNVDKLNVFKTVLHLRDQRDRMVQTQAQYNFIYGVLACKIRSALGDQQ